MREGDIRSDDVRDSIKAASAADREWLLDHYGEFVYRACPACDGNNYVPCWEKDELHQVSCTDCGTLFVNPCPPPDLLHKLYARSENYALWGQDVFPASENARRYELCLPRLGRIEHLCRKQNMPSGARLVDVGGGCGTFAAAAQDYFEDITVIEPSPPMAEACSKRGLKVFDVPVEQVSLPPGSVHVVTAFEVIEHLFSPRDFVQQAREWLVPGGLLAITCPNLLGFDIEVLEWRSDTVSHEHLQLFTPGSLAFLLQSNGFEIAEESTPGKLDVELVRKKYEAGKIGFDFFPFLERIILDEVIGDGFQEFLAKNGLSSHLWMVARRQE